MSSPGSAQENEIGFIERFALAEDRAEALKELIPGTEDYYFFHALHYQNTGDQAKLESTIDQWKKRFEKSQLRKEIENRNALLSYEADPEATLDYLTRELGLVFNHQRELQQTNPDLRTALDASRISLEAIVRRSLRNSRSLGEVSSSGIDWLMRHWGEIELSVAQQRELLGNVSRPDYPKLVAALAEDFARKESRGFGEFKVHAMLLPGQLDELAAARPEMLSDLTFVLTKLGKMRPGADIDLSNDPAEREAYLDRAWAFVSELKPAFHSLKAHVLYQRLVHDQGKGVANAERFMAYLKLPRPVAHVNPKFREQLALWRHPVDLNFDASAATGFPPIQNDESIVRAYLLKLLAGQDSFATYAPYLTEDYLKGILAEANVVAGHGDPEKWSSLLSPSAYQALKDRVDLDFDPSCKERFDGNETVKVAMHVKNVENLIVKIYEINTFNYFQNFGSRINTDLNLDGLVANEEFTFDYDEGPYKRVRRTFEFPQLDGDRGVWVVEFIGNGKSSRALIRRGNLQYITRNSTAGNVIKILDEKRQPVPGAYAWLDGKRFDQDEDGEVTIPFSNRPRSHILILADGKGFAALENLSLQGESYALAAGFYVDREELIASSDATLAVRPNFTLNGIAADVNLLDKVVLTIVSTDLDGVQSTATVRGFKLFDHKESTHTLRVPQRLASLQFRLSAEVFKLTKGPDKSLVAEDSVTINQIAMTDSVADLFLEKVDGTYQVKVLGRTGEPQVNIAVNFNLRRDDFRTDVRTTLKTDAVGSIDLGPLEGIFRVRATAPNGRDYRWELPTDKVRYPSTIHAKVGEVISLPVVHDGAGSGAFSLLEVANGSYVQDHTKAVSVDDGFVTLRGLKGGDYNLLVKEAGAEITIRVTAGEEVSDFLLSDARILEARNPKPLHIGDLKVQGDELVVTVANANPSTRIHVFSSLYVPAFDAFDALGTGVAYEPLVGAPSRYRNLYVSGRSIGDEYRYIIERRFAKKFPGNMLKRPGMLLNPWALRDTATAKDEAKAGEEWSDQKYGAGSSLKRKSSERNARLEGKSDPHNLDFLAEPASVSFNVAPGDEGVVRIKLEELGDRQYVRVLAVDRVSAVERHISLLARDTGMKDLRLASGLNPKRHFTQQNQVSILEPNKAFVIDDAATASFEAYETIGSVYQLLKTLSGGNATLNEFSFITEWPDLEESRKRRLYSKYACHELSFFLQRKDPEFFSNVVLPYLRNKKDKTFVDHYLLGDDMKAYLEPWKFAQLNVVERILLAGRLPDEKESVARDVSDWLALLPPELRIDLQNFDAALASSSLGAFGDSDGLAAIDTLSSKLAEVKKVKAEGAAVRYMKRGGELGAAPAVPGLAGEESRAAGRELASLADKDGASLADDEEQEQLTRRGRQRKVTNERLGEAEVEEADAFGLSIAQENKKKDRLSRSQMRQFYRKLEETKEWAENNYYHLPIEQQNRDLVTVNKFWNDFAQRDPRQPFYSQHIGEVARSFTEMMFALSVLDLPFKSAADDESTALDGATLTLTPKSPVILFHKEIKESVAAGQSTQLLVGQNFFRKGDRYIESDAGRLDKFVTEEFLTGVVYGCQIVVTNPTSSPQRLDLIQQIPEGAISVSGSKVTANVALRLEPYQAHTQEYFFYFPAAGKFPHFPVHVSKDQKVVAFAEPFTFNVVEELTNVDANSWAYLSQWGTQEQVLAYLKDHNLRQTELNKIAWRCREEAAFFGKVIAILNDRHHYDPVLFSYGIHHNALQPMRQYLLHADEFLAKCGAYLDAPLVSIDPVARKNYQHLEYSPLVNARTYAVGGVRKILNDRFREQYRELLRIFCYTKELDDEDQMTLAYYLLLQDRIEEGLAALAKVDREVLPTQLQYDYFKAYTAFFLEDPTTARTIAEQYVDYPVNRWQQAFREVMGQVSELAGGGPYVSRPDDGDSRGIPDRSNENLASTEPGFTFKVENRKIDLLYRNISSVTVNYYRMDLEFLFSTNPFVSSDSTRFNIIKPNWTDQMNVDPAAGRLSFDMSDEFEGENVLIEIVGVGIRKAQTYYSNNLDVQVTQNYGQLRVTSADEKSDPLAKVYVKVYAEIEGVPRFYKDGYTDLRGKFDYSSLSTNELDRASRFSILVMSPEHGSLVTEAKPPQR